jgi:hypothetical protein
MYVYLQYKTYGGFRAGAPVQRSAAPKISWRLYRQPSSVPQKRAGEIAGEYSAGAVARAGDCVGHGSRKICMANDTARNRRPVAGEKTRLSDRKKKEKRE